MTDSKVWKYCFQGRMSVMPAQEFCVQRCAISASSILASDNLALVFRNSTPDSTRAPGNAPRPRLGLFHSHDEPLQFRSQVYNHPALAWFGADITTLSPLECCQKKTLTPTTPRCVATNSHNGLDRSFTSSTTICPPAASRGSNA